MENKKMAPETLEEGCMESKLSLAENPCNKILAEADSVSLSNLSEECTTDVYSGQCEVRHVELSRKLGNGSLEESVVCDSIAGNNQINKGSLDNYADDKLSVFVNDNAINNNDVLVLERDSKSSLNEGIQIGKDDKLLHSHELDEVDKPMERGDHVLHPHRLGSPTKTEVSGNGVNLFIEVFGPSDGISGRHMLVKSDSNQEYSIEENGATSPDLKIASAKSEVEDFIGEQQESTFDIGDVVWVKTRSQSQMWWPGMISNPCSSVSDASKSEKRGSFLVKYYGSANFVWCNNSDLKTFLEYFEQMSVQNNSRNFSGSVERALCEIGQRVKSKLTCPCFSKDSQMEENSTSMNGRSKSDVLSLSQFEPATFLARIRNLACFSVNIPGKAELVVMRNCLSSFYCSIGHRDLPLHLLRSGSDAAQNAQDRLTSEVKDKGLNNNANRSRRRKRNRSDDADLVLGDKIASSGKGSESRERKKSKYLSYPYIDVNKGLNVVSTLGQETEDLKNSSSLSTKSDSMSSCSGLKSRKRGSKKPSKGHQIVSNADNINATSAELLLELCSTARDCSYLGRSKHSDSLKRFCSSFRIYAFLDGDIACKDGGSQQAPDLEKCLLRDSTEAEVQMEGSKVVKASVKESVDNASGKKSSEAENLQAKGEVIRKRAKKKKEQTESAALESTKISFDSGTKIYPNGSCMISFQQTSLPKSSTTSKKIDEKTPDIDSIPRLPDLNGTQPSLSVEHIPVGEASTKPGKSLPEQRSEGLASSNINAFDQMVFASIPSPKDAPVAPQNIPQSNDGINGIDKCLDEQFKTRPLESNVTNMGLSSFVQQSLQMGIFPSAGKPERRKRKRKEKTSQDASVIPDLNTNASDMSSPAKTLPEGNHRSPEGKSETNESGSNVKIKRVLNKVEDLGGSILLNFAPGCTVPPKETLVAKFSRFGLLKESEIQVLSDSSVQIVYERSSDARFAFRSLEKSNTFGESLLSFKLDCIQAAPKTTEKKHNLQMLKPLVPVKARKNLTKHKDLPDMSFIRQNVEKMKLTLEKAGDSLSPEMRAKLEGEIKGFLDKISSSSS